MPLTIENKKFFDKAREKYREALIKRSENPGDFDRVMDFLYALEEISKGAMKELDHQMKSDDSQCLGEEVYHYLFPTEFNQFIAEEFRKEPRITLLDANFKVGIDFAYTFFKGEDKTETTKFTIKFSNDDVITWQTPFTKTDLMKIRQRFEDKMEQLNQNKIMQL